ncbi:DUF7577 domain-containing protein [Halosimplex salinum]|uniref:DUF7577 domain-containing protein n=1 Tax=Halosimplex salinum TaxID=1710538 RepID=UPI000F4ADBD5|nr:hypothetical protein [Halosimplex salinum]
MYGWAFAAAGLVVVLLGEFLLFRYVGPDRMPTLEARGAVESDDHAETRPNGTAPSVDGTGAAGAETDAVVACRHCGTANAEAAAVVFCRSCLGRLR